MQTITNPPTGEPPERLEPAGPVPRPPSRLAALRGLARTKNGAQLLEGMGIDVGSILPADPPVSDPLEELAAHDPLALSYVVGVTVRPTEFLAEGDDTYPGPISWYTDCAALSQPYLLDQAVEISGSECAVGGELMRFNIRTPGEPEDLFTYQIQFCYSSLPGHVPGFRATLNDEDLLIVETGHDTVVSHVELGGTSIRHDHMLRIICDAPTRVRFRFNWFTMIGI